MEAEGGLKRFTGGFAQIEYAPSFVLMSRYGQVSINRWGMRDRDYELKPPPGTYRIAMLGASSVMGWGVPDGENFESILENRLNAESRGQRYEILNFAIQGYQPTQQLVAMDKAMTFSPHAVFYVAAGRELSRAAWYLVEVVQKGIAIPYQPLKDIVVRAGLRADMDETTARRALEPFRREILSWTYRYIADRARAAGAVPVFVFLPQVREGLWQEETDETLRVAAASGFVVVSLADVYKNVDINTIRLAEWDDHPNSRGHQLIAARLYDALRGNWNAIMQPRAADPTIENAIDGGAGRAGR